MKTFTCIVCPIGCSLKVDLNAAGELMRIEGHQCPRGETYARSEVIAPMRSLSTTVRIHHALHPRLPVVTAQPIPKASMRAVMAVLAQIEVHAPITINTVVVTNILNLGVDVVAARSMGRTDV
jgi:CxxC motif-containing protein